MAKQKLTPAEPAAPERAKDTGEGADLIGVLFELVGTLNTTFIILGIIALAAAALAYWGAYTGHYGIAVGAFAVLGLATLAWCIAGIYVLWLNGRAIVKWFFARRRSGAREPAVVQSATEPVGTE